MARSVEPRASRPVAVIAAAIAAVAVVASVAWIVLRGSSPLALLADARTAKSEQVCAMDTLAAAPEPAAAPASSSRASSLLPQRDEVTAASIDAAREAEVDPSVRARRVFGVIVDDAGDPVASAFIRAFALETHGKLGDATSDERGRFEIDLEEAHVPCNLGIQSPAHLPCDPVSARAGGDELRIVLLRPTFLAGTVLADPGIPLQRLQVLLQSRGARMSEFPPLQPESVAPDGSFRFARLFPGDYAVVLFAIGATPPAGELDRASVTATLQKEHEPESFGAATGPYYSGLRAKPDVVFDLRGRLRSVRMTVAGTDGVAPGDALVRVLDREGRGAATFELEDGAATLIVTGGTPDVEIWAPGCLVERLRDVTNDRDVVLRPGLARTLDVRVDSPRDLGDLAYLLFLELAPDDPSWPGPLPWLRAGIDTGGRGRLEATSPGRRRVHLKAEQLSPTGARRGPPVLVTSVVIDVDDSSEPLDVVVPVTGAELDRALAPPR